MSEQAQAQFNPMNDWGPGCEVFVCEGCDWTCLATSGEAPLRCPRCFSAELSRVDDWQEMAAYLRPPELVAPFSLSSTMISQAVQKFARGIPFAPGDLSAQNLQTRLQRIYLPTWLVDVEVHATWQAQAGFNYDVVSHQDRYNDQSGGWVSRQVSEQRIRWEDRLGRLKRTYQNVAAPALEAGPDLQWTSSEHEVEGLTRFNPEHSQGAYIRLPSRTPQDTWGAAEPLIKGLAQDECRRAAAADHIRQFNWQPLYPSLNWTLMLTPVFSTYYLDDENHPQPVRLHGRTGQIGGARCASMKKAQQSALLTLGIAGLIFLVGLVCMGAAFLFPPLFAVGTLAGIIALVVALGAMIPIVIAWQFNRRV